jgi:type IV pilus assembly protein PilB
VAKRIGELLVEGGILSQSQLEQALFAQRKDGRKLGQLLIELGLVTEVQLTQTLSRQLSVPWVSLYHVDFSRSLLNLVPRDTAEKFCLVPIFVRRIRPAAKVAGVREQPRETLYVAMDDPTNDAAIEEVNRATQLPVRPMIACASDIRAAIRVYYGADEAPPPPPSAPASAADAIPPPPVSAAVVPLAPPPPPSLVKPPPPSQVTPPPPPVSSVPQPPPSVAPESRGEPVPAEAVPIPRRSRPRMISLTLLDGTTISLPAPRGERRPSKPDVSAGESQEHSEKLSDQLTARDLVSALRAVAHGVDASEILGTEPRWEAMFSALLSILLRKGIIADWEFIEEFRKI